MKRTLLIFAFATFGLGARAEQGVENPAEARGLSVVDGEPVEMLRAGDHGGGFLKRRVESRLAGNERLATMRSQILLDMTADGLRIQIVDQEGRPAERKGRFKGAGPRGLPGENARSPIQALKASVKKAADKKKGKSARKSRR